MNTLTIKYTGNNGQIIAELLRKFHFVKDVSIEESNIIPADTKDIDSKPSIDDFAGIWADNPKTLQEIRAKAWQRK